MGFSENTAVNSGEDTEKLSEMTGEIMAGIRLVASDMDGTLVENVNSLLPEGLLHSIEVLYAHGVRFAVATGRQYANVRAMFAPVLDKIFFICENGGITVYRDEIIARQTLSTGHEDELVDDILAAEGGELWMNGAERGYLTGRNPDYIRTMRDEVHALFDIVEDPHEVCHQLLKISLLQYGEETVRPANAAFFREKYGDIYQVLAAGHGFLDFIGKNSGKGTALSGLMERLSLDGAQTVVLGDNENDMSMFTLTPHSFAMEHSAPHVRAAASMVTADPAGVIRRIAETVSAGSRKCF